MYKNNTEGGSTMFLGITDFRSLHVRFGIKEADRFSHIYCIGKSGTGKSTILINMAISDMAQGRGVAILDPHGDVSTQLLAYVPRNRITDVVYFNASDAEYPIGFNPLSDVAREHRHLVAASLVTMFKKTWADSWGPRLEHTLRFSILTLLEYPGATFLDLPRLLADSSFRKTVIGIIGSSHIREFWLGEFEKYAPTQRAEIISPLLNKVGAFLAYSHVRDILGQAKSTFQLNSVMDARKILICNFSKGEVGEDVSSLLGGMLLSAIQSAALGRASRPEAMRVPFFVYVDEAHSFVTLSFADMLAEARKYKVGLFLTHQYLEQLDERVRTAIFGNVGTLISFRVGARDAEYLAREFYPVFKESDLVSLPRYAIYLKLMIDGMTSRPFSANTLPITAIPTTDPAQVIAASRHAYGRPVQERSQAPLVEDDNREIQTLF